MTLGIGNGKDTLRGRAAETLGLHSKSAMSGLYVAGFIGGTRLMWLVDTGAVRTILSISAYQSLPDSVKFDVRAADSDVYLADGRKAKTKGVWDTTMQLGLQSFQIPVVLADIDDAGILAGWTS